MKATFPASSNGASRELDSSDVSLQSLLPGLPRPILLIASAGGHLTELAILAESIPRSDRLWITYDSPMSRSLLEGENVRWARHSRPRDALGVWLDFPAALRIVRESRARSAVTTGASLAIPWLMAARLNGIGSYFVDSATRISAPSLSMRLSSMVPSVRRYTQSSAWSTRTTPYIGSVFDSFRPISRAVSASNGLRVLVTLGTNQDYRFDRLIERVQAVVGPNDDVHWQVTSADSMLRPDLRSSVPYAALAEEMRSADVVIAHAGVGSALAAFKAGKHPVLVPRRKNHGEHVDDHQLEVAGLLRDRGLATVVDAGELSRAHLLLAAQRGITAVQVMGASDGNVPACGRALGAEQSLKSPR